MRHATPANLGLVVVSVRWQPVVARAQLRLTVEPADATTLATVERVMRTVLESPETEAAIRRVVADRLPGRLLGAIAVEVRSVRSTALTSAAADDPD
jgi:hypothetical protein